MKIGNKEIIFDEMMTKLNKDTNYDQFSVQRSIIKSLISKNTEMRPMRMTEYLSCPKCFSEVSIHANYCSKCGQRLSTTYTEVI